VALRVAMLLLAAGAVACSRTASPTSPSASRSIDAVIAAAAPAGATRSAISIDWRCVAPQSSMPGIFADAAASSGCAATPLTIGGRGRSIAQVSATACDTCRASAIALPGPTSLTASVAGTIVTLTWIAAATATSYVVEAGSAPGLSDLAAVDVGNPPGNPVSVAFINVAPGTYYVRVRTFVANQGLTLPSNEALVIVGGTPCLPVAPSGLFANVTGNVVSLAWVPGGGCNPDRYVIEAGSAPGLSDLANLPIGTATPSFVAGGVGNGVYYVRVRAANGSLVSGPSNEVVVSVGSACPVPLAPSFLSAAVSGNSVSLGWAPPAGGCVPTSYVIQAGSTSGASDLANFSTGSVANSFVAAGVASGTYYVRVRAAYGAVIGPPSNEVVVRLNAVSPGFGGNWIGDLSIDACTDIDPPGTQPIHLCQFLIRAVTFQFTLFQDADAARGTFTPITPFMSCPCGGNYGTWDMTGTIASATLTISGSGGIRGSGVGNTMTFQLRLSSADALTGTAIGNLFFGSPPLLRGVFTGTISARRQ
jgi:hypothetical protein